MLFRSRGAPERYEEDDIYWAARDLEPDQTLPESDLLKAVHTYASYFYGRSTLQKGAVDFESLDETALLCVGILLEETAEHVLGETGDLAFVEGEEIEEVEEPAQAGAVGGDPSSQGRASFGASTTQMSAEFSGQTTDSEGPRQRKRTKVKHSEAHPVSKQERRLMKRRKGQSGPAEVKILNG